MIEQFLFTNTGERVNRPDFGSGLLQMVFAPNSPELAAAVQFTVQAGLAALARRCDRGAGGRGHERRGDAARGGEIPRSAERRKPVSRPLPGARHEYA